MTKTEIIDETVAHIEKYGRSMLNDRECCYVSPGPVKGCAVGRCFTVDARRKVGTHEQKEGESFSVVSLVASLDIETLDTVLAKKYRGHQEYFWEDLQDLHDFSKHWSRDNTLTPLGRKQVQTLKEKYAD